MAVYSLQVSEYPFLPNSLFFKFVLMRATQTHHHLNIPPFRMCTNMNVPEEEKN